ncbi:unnamed protein product [Porites lobata]|uniref:Uncharacterized protein n=1 Tax=Porites lobata TaxID=104759 RepID=A0ABN8RIW3_9CNID|nr:unnamed protein product [Porites lobata]
MGNGGEGGKGFLQGGVGGGGFYSSGRSSKQFGGSMGNGGEGGKGFLQGGVCGRARIYHAVGGFRGGGGAFGHEGGTGGGGGYSGGSSGVTPSSSENVLKANECSFCPFSSLLWRSFAPVFTNLGASGRLHPTSLGSYYRGQDHDGQVTLHSGIQRWTVPYTGDYRIEAIGAAGGTTREVAGGIFRGRGARMEGLLTYLKAKQFKYSWVKRVELTM